MVPISVVRIFTRRRPPQVLAVLLLATASLAAGSPHPVTGNYSCLNGDHESTLQVHVTGSGELTGKSNSSSGFFPFDGSQTGEGLWEGSYHTDQMLATSFRLEFHEDVLSFLVHPGGPGQVPHDMELTPRYCLRLPGPGPAEPFVPPVHVLMNRGAHDTVLVRSGNAELQLRDALNLLELLELSLQEAGSVSDLPRNPDWVHRVSHAFVLAAPEVRLRMADSEAWWPQLRSDWPDLPATLRLELSLDALLLGFGEQNVRDAMADHYALTGSCRAYLDCLAAIFTPERLDWAMLHRPCLGSPACTRPAAP